MKYIIIIGCILFCSGLFGQEKVTKQISDSLLKKPEKKIYHGVSIEFLGPVFLSSIGYNLENQIKEKLLLQFDFRIAGHVGYLYSGWSVGPYFEQSIVLFGKNPKLKIGISEGIVFNPPSITGKFNDRQPWDRPPRIMYFFSANVGCEIRIVKDLFYITPELSFGALFRKMYTVDNEFNEIEITRKNLIPSIGIDFKLRL